MKNKHVFTCNSHQKFAMKILLQTLTGASFPPTSSPTGTQNLPTTLFPIHEKNRTGGLVVQFLRQINSLFQKKINKPKIWENIKRRGQDDYLTNKSSNQHRHKIRHIPFGRW